MLLDFLPISRSRSTLIRPQVVLFALLGLLLMWMAVTLVIDRTPEERQHFMRIWSLVGSAVMAVVTPHVLFPQPDFRRHLMIVPTKGTLLAEQIMRSGSLLALVFIPILVTSFAGGAFLSAVSASMLTTGIGLLSLGRYVRLGSSSQGWQEGTRGRWYDVAHEYMSVPPALPRGTMPMILATTGLFATAIVAVLFWSALRNGAALMLIPSAVVLAAGSLDLARLYRRVDAEIFHTQAFFDELLRMYGGVRSEERDAASFESIYWAPRRLRPAVWALLVQMDRRMPLGRLVAAGHLFLWVLFWNQGYSPAVMGYLLMFALAKNMAPGMIAGNDASPRAFHLLIQPAGAWILTRTLASLRWTLPWMLSLTTVWFFSSSLSFLHVVWWSLLDVALAIGASTLITLLTEQRYRKAFE